MTRTPLSLRRAADEIIACRRCPRLRAHCEEIAIRKRAAFRDQLYWGKPLPGFGDPNAWLLIVGLAPAAHGANRTGRMFTGDESARFLAAALHRAGLARLPTSTHRDDGQTLCGAFMVAAARCAPPDNKPTPAELEACRLHLDTEVRALPNVRVVLALGRIAFEATLALWKDRGASFHPKPRFAHGATCELEPRGPRLVASYHPSQQNTFTGRLTPKMMDDVLELARSFSRAAAPDRPARR